MLSASLHLLAVVLVIGLLSLLAGRNLGVEHDSPAAEGALVILHHRGSNVKVNVVRVLALSLASDVQTGEVVEQFVDQGRLPNTGQDVVTVVGNELALTEGIRVNEGDQLAILEDAANARGGKLGDAFTARLLLGFVDGGVPVVARVASRALTRC
ncbi:hypothetical protein PG985_008044 [Apiospora marii]|uniref:Secreted protein n=1 Tax=Apiospora marii TaxID=335849 RepID=A0ABR1R979_9PEZI